MHISIQKIDCVEAKLSKYLRKHLHNSDFEPVVMKAMEKR